MAELGEDIGVGLVTAQFEAAKPKQQSVNLTENGRGFLAAVLITPTGNGL
ncbi:MAG: hypothetical protein O2912_10535 [Proteobacteria bacterium]|nr:hypothetical protein [Pseudomonadota bacterium]